LEHSSRREGLQQPSHLIDCTETRAIPPDCAPRSSAESVDHAILVSASNAWDENVQMARCCRAIRGQIAAICGQ
jgi:hypothetical protein